MDPTALRSSLKQHFGFDEFRGGQQQVIEQLLGGDSSLAIFPTGSGKSLCYQMAALHLPNLTLVVSPLLALMKDQVTFLKGKGIAAECIDSSQTYEQSQQVMREVKSGHCKILMVSVERFKNERFRHFIQSIAVSLMVVDEAHCISEWGHNFRPDYLKLPSYQRQLKIPLVLLLTATATAQVKSDMAKRFSIQPQHIVQTGFYRSNLDLSVLPCSSASKEQTLMELIGQFAGSGIVYVTLQKTADDVASFLRKSGVAAQSYHAGMDNDKRQSIQHQFMQDKVQVIVATIAFGMGIDKPNIRFVVHYDLPKSIENYSQEVGRAGRDGQASKCVILANLDGLTTLENFVYGDTPDAEAIQAVVDDIQLGLEHAQWETQMTALSNQTNIRLLPLKTLLVQLELLNVIVPKYAYFAEFKFRFNQSIELILSGFDASRQGFLKQIFKHSPVKKVWATLDMNALLTEEQVERSRVIAALDYLADRGLIELQSKQNTEVFDVNKEKLSSPELTESLTAYFLEKEQKEISRIHALVAFFQTEHCLHASLASYFDDHQAPSRCGHCSVCRGEIAKLEAPLLGAEIDEAVLKLSRQRLDREFFSKLSTRVNIDSCCRFLTGITSPYLTRIRAKSMEHFAVYQQIPYAKIRESLLAIWKD
ncbi:MAG: RecQ family ATP-dependent DNA helicase [Aliiglaciecola sp.]